MIVPRRLCTTHAQPPWEIVEADDPRAAFVLCGPGTEYSDADAQAMGLTAYLAPKVEAKAVQQGEVEDKAVAGPADAKADEADEAPETEPSHPGVTYPPESRRVRGR